MDSFYSIDELKQLGLKGIGRDVKISRRASIYCPELISIGDNVRIDDFCILSGNINLGSNIHISAYCALYGSKGIVFEDYTGISSRCTIYSAMDDFDGNFLIGPIHPSHLTNVTGGVVKLEKYSQIGCNCVVFPGITIGMGAVVGALSLVREDIESWSVNYGIPCRKVKERERGLLKLIDAPDE